MTRSNVVWKLAVSQLLRHPAKLALTALAMIAAACTVVWVVSGYDALVSRFDDMADDYLGRYDMFVVPTRARDLGLPVRVVDQLALAEGVVEATPIYQTYVSFNVDRPRDAARRAESDSNRGRGNGGAGRGGAGGGNRMRMERPALVGVAAAEAPYPIVEGAWLPTTGSDQHTGVLSRGVARQYGVKAGDRVTVARAIDSRGEQDPEAESVSIKIVGIIEQVDAQSLSMPRGDAPKGAARGPASSALYVRPQVVDQIAGKPTRPVALSLALDSSVAPSEFRRQWERQLAEDVVPCELVTSQEIESGLENSFSTRSIRSQAYAATGMSMLASLFIIFTTLSMGVGERIRQFAIMRAVALTRRQAAAVIAVESLLLALVGWGGGLLAGWCLLGVMQRAKPELFSQGAALGWRCVMLSGVCAAGGALLAAIWPMRRVMQISPLEAMNPRLAPLSARGLSYGSLMLGIALIAAAPIIALGAPLENDLAYSFGTGGGLVAMAIGFLLLTPALVLGCEKLFAPLLAAMLRIDPRLLKGQLSSNLWRTVGWDPLESTCRHASLSIL